MRSALARARRVAALAVGVAVVASAALVAAPGASAATCWQRVIDDWRDGSITGTYSPACLRAALRNLPEDLRIYGNAEEDIIRALSRTVDAAPHRVLAATATRTRSTPAPAKRPARASAASPERKPTRSLAERRRRASSPPAAVAAPAKADERGGTSPAPARAAIAAAVLGLVSLVAAVGLWRARRRRDGRTI